MKILIVDDDDELRLFVERVLRKNDIDSVSAPDAGAALERLRETGGAEFDAILLDIVMPGLSGWDALAELRERGIDTPVLLVTSMGAVDDRVRGLNLGADDYIVKPFDAAELVARLEAVVRRDRSVPVLAAGDLRIDLASRTVERAGRRVEVTPREFDVLRLLAQARGQTVSRAFLLREIWSYDENNETNVVDVSIARLRRKLDSGSESLIETVVGEGYRLTGGA